MSKPATTEVRLAALEVLVRSLFIESVGFNLNRLKQQRDLVVANAIPRLQQMSNLTPFPGMAFTEPPEVRLEVLHILDEWVQFFEELEGGTAKPE